MKDGDEKIRLTKGSTIETTKREMVRGYVGNADERKGRGCRRTLLRCFA